MMWLWLLAGWVAVSAVTAPLIGRWLAAAAARLEEDTEGGE